jgi:hypothetical protein
MKSEARAILHSKFCDLQVGYRFQMVNTVMGAAMAQGIRFEKIETDANDYNAIRLDTNEKVRIRLDSLIEKL